MYFDALKYVFSLLKQKIDFSMAGIDLQVSLFQICISILIIYLMFKVIDNVYL